MVGSRIAEKRTQRSQADALTNNTKLTTNLLMACPSIYFVVSTNSTPSTLAVIQIYELVCM